MKTKILFFIVLFMLCNSIVKSKESNFFVLGGLSLPNNEISNFFNNSVITTNDTTVSELNGVFDSSKPGYNIAIKLTLELSDVAFFYGGFGIQKFPENRILLYEPNTTKSAGEINVTTTIYPISAGIHYFIFKNSFDLYSICDLSYNLISNSVNTQNSKYDLPLGKNPSESRLGFGLGIGTIINLGQCGLVIEGIYNNLNFIGKSLQEQNKTLITLRAGFSF
jgi:hypothetical protein